MVAACLSTSQSGDDETTSCFLDLLSSLTFKIGRYATGYNTLVHGISALVALSEKVDSIDFVDVSAKITTALASQNCPTNDVLTRSAADLREKAAS